MRNKSVRSRQILLREVMRPASRTWQWRRLAINESELSPSSLQGLKVISVTDSFQEAELIAGLIHKVIKGLGENKLDNSKIEKEVKKEIIELCAAFPIYDV